MRGQEFFVTGKEAVIERLNPYLWISVGAVLGANLRFVVNKWVGHWLGTGFPLGTLLVNVVGCLAAGFLGALLTDRVIPRPEAVRYALVIGFLGSLTTFSAFGWETHSLFRNGEATRALLNVGVSLVVGLAAVRVGVGLAGLFGATR